MKLMKNQRKLYNLLQIMVNGALNLKLLKAYKRTLKYTFKGIT